MRKLLLPFLPYIGTGLLAAGLVFWLAKLIAPGGSGPEVKRLQAQVDSLRQQAVALRQAVAQRDLQVNDALGQILALNQQISQVHASNQVILTNLNQSRRPREKSDADLLADLNRAHNDTAGPPGLSAVPR